MSTPVSYKLIAILKNFFDSVFVKFLTEEGTVTFTVVDSKKDVTKEFVTPTLKSILATYNPEASSTSRFIAGENIPAYTPVYYNPSLEKVFIATNDQTYLKAKVIGITIQDVTIGNDVIIMTKSTIDIPSASFIPNKAVYLGSNGTYIQIIDSSVKYITRIGTALSTTRLEINIQDPILNNTGV